MSTTVDGPSVDDLIAFLRTYYKESVGELAQRYPSEQTTLFVSWSDLHAAQPVFADRYFENAGDVTERLTEALRHYDLPIDVSLSEATVRLNKLPTPKTHTVGAPTVTDIQETVAGLRGQVTKKSQKEAIITKAVFECQRCGTFTTMPQGGDDSLLSPSECQGCDRQGPFTINHEQSTLENHQLIRLQTPPEESDDGSTDDIDIVVRGDLVDEVAPGDRIIANSRVELEPKTEDSRVFEPVGRAQSFDRIDSDYSDIDVSEHKDRIEEIATGENPLAAVAGSIAPSHQGDDSIKRALALQLFGGLNKTDPAGSSIRGNIHIMLIGDPGSGKSSLLRFVKELAPRSVFTTGKGSTAAGLTAAAVQDDFGGDSWTLKAGALVEANNGICAIDELDDMDARDQAGLLSALSDSEISVNKAGINATLPANTTVLAAANPAHGRFEEYSNIAEQFDMASNLISRFDLIFPVKDKPDEARDAKIADAILESAHAAERCERGEPVEDSPTIPAIGPETLKAYIAYGKTIKPEMSEDLKDMVRDQYVTNRQSGGDGQSGPVAVGPRMVEGVIRLAEAHARIRLSETVSVDDAKVAIAIHHEYLSSVGIDPETGEFDTDIVETGTPKSQRDRIQDIKSLIADIEEDYDAGAPVEEIEETAEIAGLDVDKVRFTIDKLREEGHAYTPSPGHIRLS